MTNNERATFPSDVGFEELTQLEPRLGFMLTEAETAAVLLYHSNGPFTALDAYDELFRDRVEAMVGPGRLEAETCSMRRTDFPDYLLGKLSAPAPKHVGKDKDKFLAARRFCRLSAEERIQATMSKDHQLLLTDAALEVAQTRILAELGSHKFVVKKA